MDSEENAYLYRITILFSNNERFVNLLVSLVQVDENGLVYKRANGDIHHYKLTEFETVKIEFDDE